MKAFRESLCKMLIMLRCIPYAENENQLARLELRRLNGIVTLRCERSGR